VKIDILKSPTISNCRKLANKDGPHGMSDPICVVYGSSKKKTKAELGRTEYIMNNANPKFKKKISLKYEPDAGQELVFKIFDMDAINRDGEVRVAI
jgi:hypothetical protein